MLVVTVLVVDGLAVAHTCGLHGAEEERAITVSADPCPAIERQRLDEVKREDRGDRLGNDGRKDASIRPSRQD